MRILLLLSCCAVLCLNGCDVPATARREADQPSPAAPKASTPASADRWTLTSDVNDLDGRRKIWLSEDGIQLRCSPKYDMVITPALPSFGHNLAIVYGEYASHVRYRIDDGHVAAANWPISTDFEGLFVPAALIPRIVKGHKLVLEYSPEYTTPETQTFDLTGLSDAAAKAGCKVR